MTGHMYTFFVRNCMLQQPVPYEIFVGGVPNESEKEIQTTGQPADMRRNFRRYVMGGTSKAVSYALAESTPGESEPSVTAEPSAEPSTEPSAEPTPATPGEAEPSAEPTSEPTSEPTAAPTDEPSPEPTSAPASDSSSSSGSTGSTTNAAATVESTATPAPVLSSTEQVEKNV